jgi:choline-glycine betaine transporter
MLGLICAAVTMAFGAAALVGWTTGRKTLTAFDVASIPMAPSTALLFLILGTVAALAARPGRGRGVRSASGVLAGLALTLLSLCAAAAMAFGGRRG